MNLERPCNCTVSRVGCTGNGIARRCRWRRVSGESGQLREFQRPSRWKRARSRRRGSRGKSSPIFSRPARARLHPDRVHVATRRIDEGGRSPPLVRPRGTPLWAVATVPCGECTVHFHVHSPSTRENFVLASSPRAAPGGVDGNNDRPRAASGYVARYVSPGESEIGGKIVRPFAPSPFDRRHFHVARRASDYPAGSRARALTRLLSLAPAIPACRPIFGYREDTSSRVSSLLSRSRFQRVTAKFSSSFDRRVSLVDFSQTSLVHVNLGFDANFHLYSRK